MEQIKELTKRLIANSFKELLQQTPFEKITIKMITDHANVIRPTFYNHFHDKYELMEWMLKDEILEKVYRLEEKGKFEEGIKLIITQFYNDKEYYKKAFEIIGQNGFAETLSDLLTQYFCGLARKHMNHHKDLNVPAEFIGRYYSSGLISVLKLVVEYGDKESIDELIDTYDFLMSHTIYELSD